MSRGRLEAEWAQTSNILCLLANVNRDTKKKPTPFTPADFNPYADDRTAQRQSQPAIRGGVGILKAIFGAR